MSRWSPRSTHQPVSPPPVLCELVLGHLQLFFQLFDDDDDDDDVLAVDALPVLSVLGHRFVQGRLDTLMSERRAF